MNTDKKASDDVIVDVICDKVIHDEMRMTSGEIRHFVDEIIANR